MLKPEDCCCKWQCFICWSMSLNSYMLHAENHIGGWNQLGSVPELPVWLCNVTVDLPWCWQRGQPMSDRGHRVKPQMEGNGVGGRGVNSSSMMGAYDLAFNSIRKLINGQTIRHAGWLRWSCLRQIAYMFKKKKKTVFCVCCNWKRDQQSDCYHISQLCSPSHHLLCSTHTILS